VETEHGEASEGTGRRKSRHQIGRPLNHRVTHSSSTASGRYHDNGGLVLLGHRDGRRCARQPRARLPGNRWTRQNLAWFDGPRASWASTTSPRPTTAGHTFIVSNLNNAAAYNLPRSRSACPRQPSRSRSSSGRPEASSRSRRQAPFPTGTPVLVDRHRGGPVRQRSRPGYTGTVHFQRSGQ